MLISENMQKIIRVLVNSDIIMSVRDISKLSKSSLGITSKIIKQLIETGYVSKVKNKLKVHNKENLTRAWGYAVSINELPKISFISAEKPKYVMEKINNVSEKNGLKYAFTLLSATEIINPYLYPDCVDLYVNKNDLKVWEKLLADQRVYPAEKGNVTLYLVDDNYFFNAKKIDKFSVISFPQLFVDVFSKGGRYIEGAEKIMEVIRNV
ncbi:hypothetical protein HY837_01450 [archaeon]|nr:hypothetical protein [archaeon]